MEKHIGPQVDHTSLSRSSLGSSLGQTWPVRRPTVRPPKEFNAGKPSVEFHWFEHAHRLGCSITWKFQQNPQKMVNGCSTHFNKPLEIATKPKKWLFKNMKQTWQSPGFKVNAGPYTAGARWSHQNCPTSTSSVSRPHRKLQPALIYGCYMFVPLGT